VEESGGRKFKEDDLRRKSEVKTSVGSGMERRPHFNEILEA